MVSLLYKDRLCLATTDKCNQKYYIQLCIGLSEVRLEEVDNGRGECSPCDTSMSMPS